MNNGWRNGCEEKEEKMMDEGKIGPGRRKRRVEDKIGEEVQRGDNRPLDEWKKNKQMFRKRNEDAKGVQKKKKRGSRRSWLFEVEREYKELYTVQ